jgi:hypothetical protein
MTIAIITIGLLVGTAFLMKNAKEKKTVGSYVLVLIGGIITFLFMPMLEISSFVSGDGGAIQIASTLLGIFFIVWAIVRIVKRNK